jgi:hypothetical protein
MIGRRVGRDRIAAGKRSDEHDVNIVLAHRGPQFSESRENREVGKPDLLRHAIARELTTNPG